MVPPLLAVSTLRSHFTSPGLSCQKEIVTAVLPIWQGSCESGQEQDRVWHGHSAVLSQLSVAAELSQPRRWDADSSHRICSKE